MALICCKIVGCSTVLAFLFLSSFLFVWLLLVDYKIALFASVSYILFIGFFRAKRCLEFFKSLISSSTGLILCLTSFPTFPISLKSFFFAPLLFSFDLAHNLRRTRYLLHNVSVSSFYLLFFFLKFWACKLLDNGLCWFVCLGDDRNFCVALGLNCIAPFRLVWRGTPYFPAW